MLTKLEHYGIRGISNDWFKSYLFGKKQLISIVGGVSNQASVKYGVPHGPVFGALLFLICINDLNQAVRFCNFYRFGDDTNLLHFIKSVNRLNKYINLDMKKLTVSLNAKQLSLNITKTELVIFKQKFPIKIKLRRKSSTR